MWANNETGILFPSANSRICRAKGVLSTPTPASRGQAAPGRPGGRRGFLSSPRTSSRSKRVGDLYIKRRTRFQPLCPGAARNWGPRGGTENVAEIVGFGRARSWRSKFCGKWRDGFGSCAMTWRASPARHYGCLLNGASELRLPNTYYLAFRASSGRRIDVLDQAEFAPRGVGLHARSWSLLTCWSRWGAVRPRARQAPVQTGALQLR
jgi:hypothetical protein